MSRLSSLRLPQIFQALSPRISPLRPHFRSLSATPLRSAGTQDSKEYPSQQRAAQLDREKINRDPNEYSKSGTDDSSAANEEAAFDPNITDPEEAKKKAGEGQDGNPLDASPANPDMSKGTAEEEGGAPKKMSER